MSDHPQHKNQRESFIKRHIGPSKKELSEILESLKTPSLEELTRESLPEDIPGLDSFSLPPPLSERDFLELAQSKAKKNKIFKSYIGMGYKPSILPGVIQRNILENPVWYTSYTPYQAELAQGRLEALLNFQTLITDLTGMEIANASLLDEGTALAEALALARSANEEKQKAKKFFVDSKIFPQNLDVLKTRSEAWGWEMVQGSYKDFHGGEDFFAAVLQYPDSTGSIEDIEPFLKKMSSKNCFAIAASDLLGLSLLKPPGEMGAKAVVGSSQNFGIPLFFGGPQAAFFATKKDYIRLMPGRIVGVSKDRHKKRAYRLSLQTREQHIRREKATSNICTAQALLAVMAGFYALYHGPEGLKKISLKINNLAQKLYEALEGFREIEILNQTFFDTLSFRLPSLEQTLNLYKAFQKEGLNLNFTKEASSVNLTNLQKEGISSNFTKEASSANLTNFQKEGISSNFTKGAGSANLTNLQKDSSSSNFTKPFLSITLNETSTPEDLRQIKSLLKKHLRPSPAVKKIRPLAIPKKYLRLSPYLQHPVFNSYHTETELLRYIHRLQNKELSLAHSMIPLGSCTMKLNAVTELAPVSWPAFSDIHPFAPEDQSRGWREILAELEEQLCEITGFKAFSFQPNAGSQGEYAGLLAIKKYHESRGERYRNLCLIPSSAHGTNPASAVMAGFQTLTVKCEKEGGMDMGELESLLYKQGRRLAAIMITYPSTYGFFEEGIKEICEKIHKAGGLVYLDGANMNAMLGLCKPAHLGFDVCHLNLHKTFCIPHGGGGPGAGPVGLSEKLKDFFPNHFCLKNNSKVGALSSAPYGSAGILLISWAYIKLMGMEGLKKSAQTAIANANYIAEKLRPYYRILFTNKKNRVAHECIIDLRKFKSQYNITVDDVAKRLMDYGFHAPTMSWPVPGTLMIEPTESESKKELDRFCSALIAIKKEIDQIAKDKTQARLLKSAPHTLEDALSENWTLPYSKQKAFYPLPWLKERKFWPPVSRIENAFGDINPFCSCPPLSEE